MCVCVVCVGIICLCISADHAIKSPIKCFCLLFFFSPPVVIVACALFVCECTHSFSSMSTKIDVDCFRSKCLTISEYVFILLLSIWNWWPAGGGDVATAFARDATQSHFTKKMTHFMSNAVCKYKLYISFWINRNSSNWQTNGVCLFLSRLSSSSSIIHSHTHTVDVVKLNVVKRNCKRQTVHRFDAINSVATGFLVDCILFGIGLVMIE